ncbi:MAG: hypothetical protein HY751_02145 [Nitrospinae bacterium]|nr:hypothetical protein [Nitrospinota bacterium]
MPEKKVVYTPPAEIRALTNDERRIVEDFHKLYYRVWRDGRFTLDVSWLGYFAIKNPLDLWIYQEIITERQPDIILETGTLMGGSAYFMACICQLLGKGRVITVDVKGEQTVGSWRPVHPLITYMRGFSTDPAIVEAVQKECEGKTVMVILDSDHSRKNVNAELAAYAPLVSVGQYLIVEDSNVNGHPVLPEHGEGPYEAIEDFLSANLDFVTDLARERFMFTLNPNGYLLRVGNHAAGVFDELATLSVADDALKRGNLEKAVKALAEGLRQNPGSAAIAETLAALKDKVAGGLPPGPV